MLLSPSDIIAKTLIVGTVYSRAKFYDSLIVETKGNFKVEK